MPREGDAVPVHVMEVAAIIEALHKQLHDTHNQPLHCPRQSFDEEKS